MSVNIFMIVGAVVAVGGSFLAGVLALAKASELFKKEEG